MRMLLWPSLEIFSRLFPAGMACCTTFSPHKMSSALRFFSFRMGADLKFKVTRQEAVLVAPCLPTPKEHLYLSNIDDQAGLRFHIPVAFFYKHSYLKEDQDPAKIIRKALEKVLVHYYPLAGRLREAASGKLKVECTGEGVLFVEADADVTLAEFGDLHPPFPCWDDLLHDILTPQTLINSPLLLIQVTRLKCKGFIFAIVMNHIIMDGMGLAQFLTALGEIAMGASGMSILPVWKRETLKPRLKPSISLPLYEYEEDEGKIMSVDVDKLSHASYFFGPKEIETLKRRACMKSSTFEALSGFLWRLRTKALNMAVEQEVRFMFPLEIRSTFEPPLPRGYYGNAIVFACAKTTAGMLLNNSLSYAVELIIKAKTVVNNEYICSVIDLMEIKGHSHFTVVGSFMVSDITKIQFRDVDFGWGKAIYGGPTTGGAGVVPGVLTFFIPYRNSNGVEGKLVPICLPSHAMQKFQLELAQAMENEAHPFISSSI
ncbi:benzyl alcohol O-benzoyltransferase isoform X2 [Cryptomeria japonica]|uniref:benzyl alcohol O-benzoyltransferase isoform X2 n=1 Tax=Cryptomeria japonica TaxID=3369 RepID=UPI0027DA0D02|nr:benzyl alcohol O-benzoyltransferase isoform X2 [Cryptomeria japonica]